MASLLLDDLEVSFMDFLKKYPDYETTAYLDELRQTDYQRLDELDHVYLDYTGGNLYGMSQLKRHHDLLSHHILGNPHSTNPSSQLAGKLVGEARQKIKDYFHAEDYVCIFTPNATGGLKIIGECYPFDEDSFLLLTFDNHNSVNGIREYAKRRGCKFSYSPINYEDLRFNQKILEKNLIENHSTGHKLFAYPAQSNVSGVKHSLEWILKAQDNGWHVLLDASAYIPTNALDLRKIQPEFVTMSFYKMFGYPTGLGCLLVRKDIFGLLKKPWFAGGTVTLASVMTDHFFLDHDHAKFEDGTINYLDIPALQIGIEHIEKIGIEVISKRVMLLTQWLLDAFAQLKHANGKPLVHVFGPQDITERGATIILNLFDADEQIIPFFQVEELANQHNFSIRTGCFCNPGIDEINNALQGKDLEAYFDSRDEGGYQDMVDYLQRMRGAIRISLGLASNFKDVYRFVELVRTFLK
jgi:selenocysteine lyase/cysteine desulfurase